MKDTGYIKEQRALSLASKPVASPEGILLRYTSNREWLTWETCKQDIMIGDFICGDLRNIAMRRMIVAKIRGVGLLSVFVPLRCKHAMPSSCVEASSQPPYASKQVDEVETGNRLTFQIATGHCSQQIDRRTTRNALSIFPTVKLSRTVSNTLR